MIDYVSDEYHGISCGNLELVWLAKQYAELHSGVSDEVEPELKSSMKGRDPIRIPSAHGTPCSSHGFPLLKGSASNSCLSAAPRRRSFGRAS